jgi:hypothetical protein
VRQVHVVCGMLSTVDHINDTFYQPFRMKHSIDPKVDCVFKAIPEVLKDSRFIFDFSEPRSYF